MRRASRRGTGRLLLLLLCGIIIGTIIGHILSLYVDHPIFNDTVNMGMDVDNPVTLHLSIYDYWGSHYMSILEQFLE